MARAMYIERGKEDEHAHKLKTRLQKLGPHFVAGICWWCDGTGRRRFEPCGVCGKGRVYGTSLGLLINNEPASESVVNQVLVAADSE